MILAGRRSSDDGQCGCSRCWHDRRAAMDEAAMSAADLIVRPFIVCDLCGNKRCPHATDHRLTCTGSVASGCLNIL